ncbi:WXG100-like domain-containing protein [Nocardia sp. IFM 10818]
MTVPLILCRADEYNSAGEVFGEICTDGQATHTSLVGVLAANAGMAGSDSVGEEWAAAYDQAAGLALSASGHLATACGQTRDLIAISVHNHAVAEAAADHGNVSPPTPPQLLPTPCLIDSVASAAGDGIPEPFGWSIVKDLVGWAWPNGHQDQLRSAETAWHTAAADYRLLAARVPRAVGLLQNQQSDEIPAAIGACTERQSDLTNLGDIYQLVGDACGEYAQHLDDAHHEILEELQEFAVEFVAGEVAFAVLAPVTAGLSEVVGNTAMAARIAVKARRIATIIANLATRARAIATRITETLVGRARALADKVGQWVDAARPKLLPFLRRGEPDSGLTQQVADDILATPKGSRPDPTTYLSPDYVKYHLAQFEDGAVRFQSETGLAKYGIGQRDGTSFVMPKAEADALLVATKGDRAALEKALGLQDGFLQNNTLVRVDIPDPNAHGLRIPSGNEAGANSQWIPGGRLPGDAREAIIDAPGMTSGVDYHVSVVTTGGAK